LNEASVLHPLGVIAAMVSTVALLLVVFLTALM
jgi:hypothetical protein